MTTNRRLIVLVSTMALVMATVATSAAAKGKPAATPERFAVTMSFVDGFEGFSTAACMAGGDIEMELDHRNGGLIAVDTPKLDVKIGADLSWYRYYPYFNEVPTFLEPADYPREAPVTGNGLEGCHGAGIDVYVDTEGDLVEILEFTGLLALTVDDGTVEFLWHSDYYRVWEPINKKRSALSDIEDFSYLGTLTWRDESGGVVMWDPAVGGSGVASGQVSIEHFSPGSYVPFVGSPRTIEFHLEIVPIP